MLTVPSVVTEPAPRIPAQQGLCCCYSLLCCLFAFLFSVMLTASSKNILVTLKDKIGNLILFQIHINRKQKSILLQHDCPIQHQQHYSDNKWITISLEKGQSHNSFFFSHSSSECASHLLCNSTAKESTGQQQSTLSSVKMKWNHRNNSNVIL